MKIAVGCDHGGLEHKNAIAEHLKSEGLRLKISAYMKISRSITPK